MTETRFLLIQRLDFKLRTGCNKTLKQSLFLTSSRSPNATTNSNFLSIKGKSKTRLHEHTSSILIAGIVVEVDGRLHLSTSVTRTNSSQAQEAIRQELIRRTFTGLGENESVQQVGQNGRLEASTKDNHIDEINETSEERGINATFVVAQLVVTRVLVDSVGAANAVGHDHRHDERTHPGTETTESLLVVAQDRLVLGVSGGHGGSLGSGRHAISRLHQRIVAELRLVLNATREGVQQGSKGTSRARAKDLIVAIHLSELLVELLAELLGNRVDSEVPGHAVVAAEVDDAGASALGGGVEVVDHLADPITFAGDVTVGGAVDSAEVDDRSAVQVEGTHSGDKDAGVVDDRAEAVGLGGVTDEDIDGVVGRGFLVGFSEDFNKSSLVAASDSPLDGVTVLLDEVLSAELTSETGGAVENKIVLTFSKRCDLLRSRQRLQGFRSLGLLSEELQRIGKKREGCKQEEPEGERENGQKEVIKATRAGVCEKFAMFRQEIDIRDAILANQRLTLLHQQRDDEM